MSTYPMAPGQQKMNLPLSMLRRSGSTVYVSGHGAVDEAGRFAADTFEGQFRWTMDRLCQTLHEAGVGFRDVVSVRAYVQDPADLPLYNRLYREFFAEPFPARTTVTNCLPLGLLFEIECIAEATG